MTSTSGKAENSIWHQHLGHPHSRIVESLASKGKIQISSWTKPSRLCFSYQMGKSYKLPFSRNNERAEFVFQKIHCGLWGTSPILSFQHFSYYAIFVDDYSRFTWFYPFKRKSDFSNCFLKFQRMIENQFDKTIKIFQCDGSGEFTNKYFLDHLISSMWDYSTYILLKYSRAKWGG